LHVSFCFERVNKTVLSKPTAETTAGACTPKDDSSFFILRRTARFKQKHLTGPELHLPIRYEHKSRSSIMALFYAFQRALKVAISL
jgi:hypothetical protein